MVVGLEISESNEAQPKLEVRCAASLGAEATLGTGELHLGAEEPMLFSFLCCCKYCSFLLRIRSCSFHSSRSLSFSAWSCFFRSSCRWRDTSCFGSPWLLTFMPSIVFNGARDTLATSEGSSTRLGATCRGGDMCLLWTFPTLFIVFFFVLPVSLGRIFHIRFVLWFAGTLESGA